MPGQACALRSDANLGGRCSLLCLMWILTPELRPPGVSYPLSQSCQQCCFLTQKYALIFPGVCGVGGGGVGVTHSSGSGLGASDLSPSSGPLSSWKSVLFPLNKPSLLLALSTRRFPVSVLGHKNTEILPGPSHSHRKTTLSHQVGKWSSKCNMLLKRKLCTVYEGFALFS